MADAIRHRGPDGSGVWSDHEAGLALSHRRLAVIDLTETGAQPMTSASGRYVISYNGEIYNYEALRAELRQAGWDAAWRGTSDTEVLLAAIEHWGVAATLPRLDGMFALALWDRKERRLCLARDRFGEKPLYYGLVAGRLIFGSELTALKAAAPDGLGEYDPRAIDQLIRTFCIPAPRSIYRSIAKLPPATMIVIGQAALAEPELPEPVAYWSATDTAIAAAQTPFRGSEQDAAEQLAYLLERSIGLRLVADVPVGVMLSSGIDSATMCALAQRGTSAPLRSFTVGVDDPAYDEAPRAAAIAAALGTDHSTIMVGAAQALEAVPEMAAIYSEPFADPSQVVTTLLSRALRSEVTVALSGDAGDELFGGYVRHLSAPRIWSRLRGVPRPLRRVGSSMVRTLGQDQLSAWLAQARGARGEASGRIHKALGLLDSTDEGELYSRLLEVWPQWTRRHDREAQTLPGVPQLSFARRMMLADTIGYMPSDVLAKVDRAAMSTSLETRAPFLCPDVFAFAWSLPDHFLFQANKGKQPLRRVAERHLPAELLDTPKRGFAPPIGAWLRGPLREWADELVRNEQVSGYGVIDGDVIRAAWQSHQGGRFDESPRLWPVLMFEAWRRAQGASAPAAASDPGLRSFAAA